MLIFEKNVGGTKEVKFSRFEFDSTNTILQSITHITTVKLSDILKEPICSLYHMDYLHDEYADKLQKELTNYEWVEFGEVFELIKGQIASGEVEEVDIPSSQIQIKQAINALGRSLKSIYKDKRFRKAKFTLNKDGSVKLDSRGQAVLDEKPCKFCPLAGGKHSLCNSNFYQDKLVLKENNRVF